MLLLILLLLFQISCVRTFAKIQHKIQHKMLHKMQYSNIIKDTILNDPKMPMIYTNKYLKKCITNGIAYGAGAVGAEGAAMPCGGISKNIARGVANSNYNRQFISAEHIYPQCLLNVKQSNDMHNIIKTLNTLNANRSNYKFHEDYDIKNKNWLELECNNYVNHKDKVFVPNNDSRGFISRAILYMYKEYNCNPHKIIDLEILKKWYYNFSPTIEERYHNDIIKRLQNKNNIFISNYNKKNKGIKKILDSL
jgi:hypothetical protein